MIALHDAIEDHPKFVGLSDDAFGLWVRGIGYCRRELTDGFIPEAAARARCRGRRPASAIIAELCAPPAGAPGRAPLWSKVVGGYQVHDYLEWNPERVVVEASRKQKREAAALGGKRSGESRRSKTEAQGEAESKHGASLSGSSFGSPMPNPPDPVPRREIQPEPCVPLEPRKAPDPDTHTSDSFKRIFNELENHPQLASVVLVRFAQTLESRAISSGAPIDDVVKAIADAAADTPEGEQAHATQRRVRSYCDHAKKRAATRANGPAPRWQNDRVQHDPPGKQAWKSAEPLAVPPNPNLRPEDL